MVAGVLVVASLMPVATVAQISRRSAGLVLRGGAWSQSEGQSRLVWTSDDEHTLYDGAGLGGWISFIGRVGPNLSFELSLGTVVRTVEEVKHAQGTDTYVEGVVPFLAGLRFLPLAPRRGAGVVPYLSLGGGPYWVGDVVDKERVGGNDTSVDFEARFGGYVGFGVDVMVTDWFGLNFDLKRHFVDLREDHELSGVELGGGLGFFWGRRGRSR
jgi:outer membrane protein W